MTRPRKSLTSLSSLILAVLRTLGFHYHTVRDLCTSVTILSSLWVGLPENRGLIPSGGRTFSLHHCVQTAVGLTGAVPRAQIRAEAHPHLVPKVKNEWS
jgi:hypothetical protein